MYAFSVYCALTELIRFANEGIKSNALVYGAIIVAVYLGSVKNREFQTGSDVIEKFFNFSLPSSGTGASVSHVEHCGIPPSVSQPLIK